MVVVMILLWALILEALLPEPENRWHPVAWLGALVSRCEARFYAPTYRAGVLCWCLVMGLGVLVAYLGHRWFGLVFDVLLVWMSIGWRSLFEHVQAVLRSTDVAQARAAVSRIVSRDSQAMSVEECRRSALESLAENASDAIVAPIFWFLIFGVWGAVVYRIINTLDAMWGYRTARYQYFGYWAAKVDDVANYIPARLTAWLMLRAGRGVPWSQVEGQARTHPSPNAGYPEVALAYAADIHLGGDVVRQGERVVRPVYGAASADTLHDARAQYAVAVVVRALMLMLLLSFLLWALL